MYVILHIKDDSGKVTPIGHNAICYLGASIEQVEGKEIAKIQIQCSKGDPVKDIYLPSGFIGRIYFNSDWMPKAETSDGKLQCPIVLKPRNGHRK